MDRRYPPLNYVAILSGVLEYYIRTRHQFVVRSLLLDSVDIVVESFLQNKATRFVASKFT